MKLLRKELRICFVVYFFILFVLFSLNEFNQRNNSYFGNLIVKRPTPISSVERKIEAEVLKVRHSVAIWGDMKIARYLWFDILGARKNEAYQIENFSFRLASNTSGMFGNKVLVLVGNGRSEANIAKLRDILDYLTGNKKKLKDLRKAQMLDQLFLGGWSKLALLMIGHELCKNDWLKGYLGNKSRHLKAVFVTYDALEISERSDSVFRWPLGVASYRHFPPLNSINLDLNFRRPYFCNFVGTVYKSSSRQDLVKRLGGNPDSGKAPMCLLSTRDNWSTHESREKALLYHYILKNSDFTLCPVGLNEETYRIYEAFSMGSIPIIEDRPPSFVADEHARLVNHCYSPRHPSNSDAIRDDLDPLLGFVPVENENRKFNDFLLESGSYFYDYAGNGAVFTVAGFKRRRPNDWNSTVDRWLGCCHRFLKNHGAPALFAERITRDLVEKLRKELTREDILAWRKLVVAWYQDFRLQIRDHFLDVINHMLKPGDAWPLV